MPETNNKLLLASTSPSSGHDQAGDNHNNRLVELPAPAVATNASPGARPRRSGDATDFTATQELKLKAGNMRMARLQISISQLRLEMDQTNKLLEELCKVAREKNGS